VNSDRHPLHRALVDEEDEFRVVIRGASAVDELLKRTIDAAFPNGMPRELGGRTMGRRVELARGLDLISGDLASAISQLSEARSFLAHRVEDELPESTVERLVEATDGFILGSGGRPESRIGRVGLAIAAIYATLQRESEEAAHQRSEAAAALVAWRAQRVLTEDEIRELLRDLGLSVEHDD